MDKRKVEWWKFPKWTDEYEQGTNTYIDQAFASKSQGNQIQCPCNKCDYRYWRYRDVVKDHIICNGFVPRTNDFLVNDMGIEKEREVHEHAKTCSMVDDMQELLHDIIREGPNEDTKKFYKLLEEGQEELYSGCKAFSKLSFIMRLFIYKCDYKLSIVQFCGLLELLREVLPDAKLPSSYHEANKVLKMLGLEYKKIDACPNDCMLYWEEHENATSCHVCETPRWKSKDNNGANGDPNGTAHRIPQKILRYFPIKKRLQRLYMCEETARHMSWELWPETPTLHLSIILIGETSRHMTKFGIMSWRNSWFLLKGDHG